MERNNEGLNEGKLELESLPSPGADTFQRSPLRDLCIDEPLGLQTHSGVGEKLNLLLPEAHCSP